MDYTLKMSFQSWLFCNTFGKL